MRRASTLLLLAACGPRPSDTDLPEPDPVVDTGSDARCSAVEVTPGALAWDDALVTAATGRPLTLVNPCEEHAVLVALDLSEGRNDGFRLEVDAVWLDPLERGYTMVRFRAADYSPRTGVLEITGAGDPVQVPLSAEVDPDQDDDGFEAEEVGGSDCDDLDPAVYPGAGGELDCVSYTDLDDWIDGAVDGAENTHLGLYEDLSRGDVDGDGKIEILLGAAGSYGGYGGGVMVLDGERISGFDGPVTDLASTWLLSEAPGPFDVLCGMGSFMGDNTGDGVDDLAVGEFYADDLEPVSLALFEGGPHLAGALTVDDAILTLTGAETTQVVVHSGLDTTGDGVAEVIFAEPFYTTGNWGHRGSVVIMETGDLSGSVSLFEAEARLFGGSGDEHLGYTAGGGDVDGDGYDDLLVSAPAYPRPENLEPIGAYYLVDGGRELEALGYVDDHASLVIEGHAASESLGRRCEPILGDLDGDGERDDLVTASSPGAGGIGEAYVFMDLGAKEGRITWEDADIYIRRSPGSPDSLGKGTAVGDFDGDGADDIAFGSVDIRQEVLDLVHVWLAPTLRDPPHPLTPEDSDWFIEGKRYGDLFGWFVTSADYDADGVDELIVSGPDSGAHPQWGRVYFLEAPPE